MIWDCYIIPLFKCFAVIVFNCYTVILFHFYTVVLLYASMHGQINTAFPLYAPLSVDRQQKQSKTAQRGVPHWCVASPAAPSRSSSPNLQAAIRNSISIRAQSQSELPIAVVSSISLSPLVRHVPASLSPHGAALGYFMSGEGEGEEWEEAW